MTPLFRVWLFCVLLTSCPYSIHSQEFGGRAFGMAGSSITAINQWSGLNNPGSIGLLKQNSISVGTRIPYGIMDLGEVFISVNRKISKGMVSLSGLSRGLSALREDRVSIAYGYGMDNFSFGGGVNLIQIKMGEYGSAIRPVIELGGVMRVIPKLDFGLSVFNVSFSGFQINGFKEWLPISIRTGLSYRPSKSFLVSLEFQKSFEVPLNTKIGIEYNVNGNFGFQFGVGLNPGKQSAGFYFKNLKWSINPAVSFDPNLGTSAGISFSYYLNEKDG
jgi:hypothetical protein